MSISGVAFWNSNYAYEIMGTQRTSYQPQDFLLPADKNEIPEETFPGIKPRVDEFIPSMKLLGQRAENSEENLKTAELSGSQGVQNTAKTVGTDDLEEILNKKDKESSKKNEKDGEYSEEERKVIDELKARDNEVRTHEQAHVAAGGAHIAGGISYATQTGPDGRQYAIGGEVSIDTSPVKGDPEATITKMQTVRAAALAPANPSDADRAVAASASQMESNARAELAEKNAQQVSETGDKTDENVKNAERTQNNIVAAISAYTNNFGTDFTSKINFSA